MARISGVDVPDDKKLRYALLYIYGIGRTRANQVVQSAALDPEKRVRELTEMEVTRLREVIERDFIVEGDLRREIRQNIQRLIDINSYRGQRHRRSLPVHGQRTRTNARTRRGPRRTVAGRRRAAVKK